MHAKKKQPPVAAGPLWPRRVLIALAVLAAAILIVLAVQGRAREQRTIARVLTTQARPSSAPWRLPGAWACAGRKGGSSVCAA